MRMFLVVLRRSGPQWDPSMPLDQQFALPAHAAFVDDLVDRGVIVLGGPLSDETRVVYAAEADSEEALRAELARDPWDGTHLVVDVVEQWTIRLDGRSLIGGRRRSSSGVVLVDEAVGRGVVDDGNSHQRYGYRAPGFNFEARLIYNESRLVLEHPGIGSRVLERGSPAATNLRSLD